MKLTFLGAAAEVTGSCYLLEARGVRFLVDCGLFQGRHAPQRNRAPFAFDAREIAFVLLSHAHIDHSGMLPRLSAAGFKGPVYTTTATRDLLGVLLPDSAYLQERDAAFNGNGGSRGRPLYTVADVFTCLKQIVPVDYAKTVAPAPGVRCVFRDAGHILGSAILEVDLATPEGTARVVFSGDLGQPGHPLVRDADRIRAADVLLVESTYGDRLHKNMAQTLDEFAFALTDTLRSKRGNVVIPSFAVGRTQDILYLIFELHRQGRLPDMDVYVDSPMALAATRVMLAHTALFDAESAAFSAWLRHGTARDGPRIHLTESLEDSMRINSIRSGAVIISASGMCDGGRIRHHLRHNISRPESSVVFVGFQAAGTLGRRIVDGAETVTLFRERYPVRARIFTINGLSAHADREALLQWLEHFERPPRATFVVHGEPVAAHALRDAIEERLRWQQAAVPTLGQATDL